MCISSALILYPIPEFSGYHCIKLENIMKIVCVQGYIWNHNIRSLYYGADCIYLEANEFTFFNFIHVMVYNRLRIQTL